MRTAPTPYEFLTLTPVDRYWPANLSERLGTKSPSSLSAIGNSGILAERKIAVFCSVRCPGDKILAAYDSAQKLRDGGVTVISGFHSPVEKECFRILLRGKQPIIVCLARAMEKIRIPTAWRRALDDGRLLIISPFEKRPVRPTTESSHQRNELVAALSGEMLIIHAEPGGSVERISQMAEHWGVPMYKAHSLL